MQRRQFIVSGTKAAILTKLGGNTFSLSRDQDVSRSSEGVRTRSSLDEGWRFHLGDISGGGRLNFDDSKWTEINLPHDWSIAGPFAKENPASHGGGYLPTGIGWYRKKLEAQSSERSVRVEFDGVYMNSDVWINGHHLGLRPYGYSSFEYDLTPYLHPDGSPDILAVRVDNSEQPNSRWYTGSGIYRHVWLNVTSPLHIDHWGTSVTTPSVDAESAIVRISVGLRNKQGATGRVAVRNSILSYEGHELLHAEEAAANLTGTETLVKQDLHFKNPKLWSPDEPNLYVARTAVLHAGKAVDGYDTVFGIRTFAFDADKGFFLNGHWMKLKGMCMHYDLGALGAAFSDAAAERRLKLLKEMGCNAIRMASKPPAPQLLDLCDRMGFLVIDEAFDEWSIGKSGVPFGYHRYFKEWGESDLRDMILRDRNHPSIILWSIGNEIPDKGEPSGVETCAKLSKIVHETDPTRPVTASTNYIENANRSGFSEILDVVGYNGGGNSTAFYESDHAKYPKRKMYGSEVPHTQQTRGVYTSTKGYCSAYEQAFVEMTYEDSWRLTRNYSFLAGEFRWVSFDYIGEPTRHKAFHIPANQEDARWPARSSEAGILDMCGFPKDAYFFYKSQWTERPMLHLLPHWTWPGSEGKSIFVWCFSNCDSVELFLNGRSLGKKRVFADGPMHLEWVVNYEPGNIRAIGWKNGQEVCHEEIKTAGAPAKVVLVSERLDLWADGKDLVYVKAAVTDSAGTILPDANHRIHFVVSGPAKLVAVDNGDTNSHESFLGESILAFHGLCIAVVRAESVVGEITTTATSPGLQASSARIQAHNATA